jgi:hypothetical protein
MLTLAPQLILVYGSVQVCNHILVTYGPCEVFLGLKVRILGITLEQKKPVEAERKKNDRQLGSA